MFKACYQTELKAKERNTTKAWERQQTVCKSPQDVAERESGPATFAARHAGTGEAAPGCSKRSCSFSCRQVVALFQVP